MFEELKDIICEFVEVEADDINESSRFSEDLGFNSFDFLSMLGEAEDRFEIEIDETEAAGKKTVGELVAYFGELK